MRPVNDFHDLIPAAGPAPSAPRAIELAIRLAHVTFHARHRPGRPTLGQVLADPEAALIAARVYARERAAGTHWDPALMTAAAELRDHLFTRYPA